MNRGVIMVDHKCKQMPENVKIYLNYTCGCDTSTYYWVLSGSAECWDFTIDEEGYEHDYINSIPFEFNNIKACPFCGEQLK